MLDLDLQHGGFLGVAEMLIETKRRGRRVVEVPATLESRLLGESKMKIVRTSDFGGYYVAPLDLKVKLIFTPVSGVGERRELTNRVSLGPGSSTRSGKRKILKPWRASNSRSPGWDGAATTTRSGGRRRHSSHRYDWMPPGNISR